MKIFIFILIACIILGAVLIAVRSNKKTAQKAPTELTNMDKLLAQLLETWDQRYTFNLNREEKQIKFSIPNFELFADGIEDNKVRLTFMKDGKTYGKVVTFEEAPEMIEMTLFPTEHVEN